MTKTSRNTTAANQASLHPSDFIITNDILKSAQPQHDIRLALDIGQHIARLTTQLLIRSWKFLLFAYCLRNMFGGAP